MTPVQGVLVWEDGTPIAGATITFMPMDPKGWNASGFTDVRGKFSLTTLQGQHGVLPGDYKIIVTKSTVIAGAGSAKAAEVTAIMKEVQKDRTAQKPKRRIPVLYADPQKTPLTWRVESGGPESVIKLKKR